MKIENTLAICSPPELCFDLVRSVQLNANPLMGHKMLHRPSNGLIGLHDQVHWNLKALGISRQCILQVTQVDFMNSIVEEMVEGPFKSMRQEYHFKYVAGFTHHTHIIEINTSLGMLGNAINSIFLARRLDEYLKNRMYFLKDIAECDKWKAYLPGDVIYKAG